jgi:hypothetical protein
MAMGPRYSGGKDFGQPDGRGAVGSADDADGGGHIAGEAQRGRQEKGAVDAALGRSAQKTGRTGWK